MNKIVIVSLMLFQTTLFAENLQTVGSSDQAETDASSIKHGSGSQYNLDGKKDRDGQYRSSYSTKSVDTRDRTSDSSSGASDNNDAVLPVVPLLIIRE